MCSGHGDSGIVWGGTFQLFSDYHTPLLQRVVPHAHVSIPGYCINGFAMLGLQSHKNDKVMNVIGLVMVCIGP